MQRRNITPFNPKATITILKEDPKVGIELNEIEKRVLIDRYLEVNVLKSVFNFIYIYKNFANIFIVQAIDDKT
jgi:hypothetical protein